MGGKLIANRSRKKVERTPNVSKKGTGYYHAAKKIGQKLLKLTNLREAGD